VFKIVTALAALKHDVISKGTTFRCGNSYELGRARFHCWRSKHGGHGYVTLRASLEQSCDIFYYNVARRLSPEAIAEVAQDLGLGTPTGIDIQGEKAGVIPTKAWKKAKQKKSWTTGDTLNMAIGQGYVLATPLQLVRMMAVLVNGQRLVTPFLVQSTEPDAVGVESVQYSSEHVDAVLEGLRDVVNSQYGTAYNYVDDYGDVAIAGKTGSSQVCRITAAQRLAGDTKSADYWKKEHAMFVAYAPVSTPRIAMIVLIEHGGSGAAAAAPVVNDLISAAWKYIVPPCTKP
jgi:penicillin-binding protein 2